MRPFLLVPAIFAISVAACTDDRPAPPKLRVAAEPVADPRPARAVDLTLGNGLEMRRPLRDGKLALVPIVATQIETAAAPATHYVTLAAGLASHKVSVREIGHGDRFEVDQVRIRNKSRLPLFVMTGEVILDGMQDRVLAEDRVIAPGKTVRVSVRCVERGREDGHLAFHASGLAAELAVRKTVVHAQQTDVWTMVDGINHDHRMYPPSMTYRGVAMLQQTGAQAERRDQLVQALAHDPEHDKMVGLAAVLDGQVVAVERFATPELFTALESELVGSYVASDDRTPHEGRTFLPDDVRALAATTHSDTKVLYSALVP